MAEFFKKARKAAYVTILFAAIYVILFYISNLDIDSIKQSAEDESPVPKTKTEDQFNKRFGAKNSVSFLSYNEWAERDKLREENDNFDKDPDNDGLPNFLEYAYNTNPLSPDTDGDKFTDRQEITNGYDPDAPGDARPKVEISIPKVGVNVPMIWSSSEDEKTVNKDLESGVSHFSKTAAPGQKGNMVLSGHSSNYVWAKGIYNHIFKDLNDLTKDDIIKVKSIQEDGRVIIHSYKVVDKFVTTPDDPKIFAEAEKPAMTLSTCWPIGTRLKRLIIRAELDKSEKG